MTSANILLSGNEPVTAAGQTRCVWTEQEYLILVQFAFILAACPTSNSGTANKWLKTGLILAARQEFKGGAVTKTNLFGHTGRKAD